MAVATQSQSGGTGFASNVGDLAFGIGGGSSGRPMLRSMLRATSGSALPEVAFDWVSALP
jgi:hypothetical protein